MRERGIAAMEELDHTRSDAPAQADGEGLDPVGSGCAGDSTETDSSPSAAASGGRRTGAQHVGTGSGTGLSIVYFSEGPASDQERG